MPREAQSVADAETSMAVISLLFLAVMYVVHHPLMVSDRMDLDTLARSRQLEKRLSEEMRHLETEFEERRRAAEQRQKAENFWRGDKPSEDEKPWSPFTNITSKMPSVTCPAPVSLWRALWMISLRPVGCLVAGRLTHSWRTAWALELPLRSGGPSTRHRNSMSWCPFSPHKALRLSWR
ncbi:inositol 1,4,5-trisphosphate receptor-interacting protein-like 1 isoform X3 [Meriones unguiculatus]|uniref:inositol 1,4,5-trisphosphate receptor-interacting protein-like 1 isoform X3 n=1 Tax=Meriones unguiculatus TaxID=10047 RepID=UPI00293EA793|nr:inositol 1,4,5-trisphosphate receptor-interacting protein-like 1 isoform X3 [Meriones unguiculatus]